jgi:tetratricopeptide (TPR) repeat protein
MANVKIVGRVPTGAKTDGPPPWEPTVGEPFLDRARAALAVGDLDAADAIFHEGEVAAPHDPRLPGGRALVKLQGGDLPAAVQHGKRAAALRDPPCEVLFNLGVSLDGVGRADEATEAYQRAFRADPSRPEPIAALVARAIVPQEAPDAPDAPEPLSTLHRLELYDVVAQGPLDGSFAGALAWAQERGAPWGAVAAWLVSEGIADDRAILDQLTARDRYLEDASVQGFVLGKEADLRTAVRGRDEVAVLSVLSEVPSGDGKRLLALRLRDGQDRAEIPKQRTNVAHVIGFCAHLLAALGPDGAIVFVVDPPQRMQPRRAFILTPGGEVEVEGVIADLDGALVDGWPPGHEPDDLPVPHNLQFLARALFQAPRR